MYSGIAVKKGFESSFEDALRKDDKEKLVKMLFNKEIFFVKADMQLKLFE